MHIQFCKNPMGWLGLGLLGLILFQNPALTLGQFSDSGSGSRQNREQALKLIPLTQLNPPTREKISEVVESASLYRRLPINSIVADADYFRFLVRYPEVIVNIWQLMGVTQMSTQRTGPFTIDTDDGAGTLSSLDLIYGNENLHIFYGTGAYEGPVFKRKINGRCVLVLRTDYRKDNFGQNLVVNQMDVFLKLDNVGANIIAKTVQPIVGPTADQNFLDSLKFVQRLNETTVDNGPGVQHMAGRLNLDDEIRQKFIEAAGQVYERAAVQRVSAELERVNVPTISGGGYSTSDYQSGRSEIPQYAPTSQYAPAEAASSAREPSGYYPTENQIPAYRLNPIYLAPDYSKSR